MTQTISKEDLNFEIQFYEGVFKRLPEDFHTVEILANLYTQAGRIEEGLKMDQLAVKIQSKNATAHYNLACSYCLKGMLDAALKALKKAVDLGYNDLKWLMKDPDLNALHDMPEFVNIVKELKLLKKA